MESKYIYIVREYTDIDDWRPINLEYCSSIEKAIEAIEEYYAQVQLEEVWEPSSVNTLSIAKVELDNREAPIIEYKLYSKSHFDEPSVIKQPSEWDRLEKENPDGI